MDTNTLTLPLDLFEKPGLTVSQVTQHLSALIRHDDILQDVWVRGEVSNLTRAASGHIYFSLKDDGACLTCVMWRTAAARLRFRLEPGQQVLTRGSVDVYAPRGQYQLIVQEAQPDGAGAFHVALEQAKQRLAAEGLLDDSRKRSLPAFPTRVALVTSLTGAVVRDVCVILRAAPQPPSIVLVPAVVQGASAEASLCAALQRAGRESGADLIILARGGGSTEDLWAFNQETVARAVAAAPIPVISAVGHETDFTLVDFVSDLRAPTPTAAAEIVAGRRADVLRRLVTAERHVVTRLGAAARHARARLEALERRRPLAHPLAIVATRQQRVDELLGRVDRLCRRMLTPQEQRLALAAQRLESASPLALLARGYAVVTHPEDGTVVRSAAQARPGDLLGVRLRDGRLEARVESVEPDPENREG
jgi:exodeoxyribonuclease VII large subunit